MTLILNLSGLGARPTGLGVYGAVSGEILEAAFEVKVIHGSGYREPSADSWASPAGIALGSGTFASARRYLFLSSLGVGEGDLLYSPSHHYVPGTPDQILTIHDLIGFRFPKQHPAQWLYFKYGVARQARKVAAIFTISETVKSELQESFAINGENIFVVPPPIRTDVFIPARGMAPSTPKFLLCVGGRFDHKNVHELLFNHAAWSSRYQVKVVSCSGAYKERLARLVKQLGLEHKVELLGFITLPELVQLYQQCAALVYPSLAEGFGMPPLEALSCGSPAIVSDIAVHREICGEAAIYVRLGRPSAWSQAIESLQDTALVQKKIADGRNRVAFYSTEAMSHKLLNAVRTVAFQRELVLEPR